MFTRIEHLIDFASSSPLEFRPGDRVGICADVRRGDAVYFTELIPRSYLLKKVTVSEVPHHPGSKYWVDRGAEPGSVAFRLMETPAGSSPNRPPRVILKKVGYWHSDREPHLPKPQALQRPGWHPHELERIVTYLRAGHHYISAPGYSYCRFSCGVTYEAMGSRTYYDGEWVWPEGLAHYVERHAVCLPEAFVSSMQSHGWEVPDESGLPPSAWDRWGKLRMQFGEPQLRLEEESLPEEDLSFWIAWATRSASPQLPS